MRKSTAAILFLLGVFVGLGGAHCMPHDWSKPSWERTRSRFD